MPRTDYREVIASGSEDFPKDFNPWPHNFIPPL
jgi:hypothetical protein